MATRKQKTIKDPPKSGKGVVKMLGLCVNNTGEDIIIRPWDNVRILRCPNCLCTWLVINGILVKKKGGCNVCYMM